MDKKSKLQQLARQPGSAVARLAHRMQKTSTDWGSVLSSALGGGAVGALPGVVFGALKGRAGGRGQMLHDATVGALVGAAPSALYSAHGAYEEEKYKEKALREYMARGGSGSEFLYPNAPNGPRT